MANAVGPADQESEPKDAELRLQARRFRQKLQAHIDFLEDLLRRVQNGEFDDRFADDREVKTDG